MRSSARELAHMVDAMHLGGHRLHLRFRNGAEGEIDFAADAEAWTGVLAPLRDVEFFRQVTVDPEWGCLSWPGDIELDPDVLYSRITGAPLPGETRV